MHTLLNKWVNVGFFLKNNHNWLTFMQPDVGRIKAKQALEYNLEIKQLFESIRQTKQQGSAKYL